MSGGGTEQPNADDARDAALPKGTQPKPMPNESPTIVYGDRMLHHAGRQPKARRLPRSCEHLRREKRIVEMGRRVLRRYEEHLCAVHDGRPAKVTLFLGK